MKKYLVLSILALTSCTTKPTTVVVDTPVIPVYIPADVKSEQIFLHVQKDEDGNSLYVFDETNLFKLKKLLLDVTKNNNYTREALCYYNEDVCKVETKKK